MFQKAFKPATNLIHGAKGTRRSFVQSPASLFEGATVLKEPNYGLVCPNVDLTKVHDWTQDHANAIKEKIHENKGVICFTNQTDNVGPDHHVHFASLFGDVEVHTAVKGIPGYPEILEIQREKDAEIIFGEQWHSDHSFQGWPASYSFLRVTSETTPYGTNNTQFVNTIDAFRNMSPSLKEILLNLKISHSQIKAYGPDDGTVGGGHKVNSRAAMSQTKGMTLLDWESNQIQDEIHPVVISHPMKNEPAIFISETFTNGIVGMSPSEGMALILMLQNLMTQPENLFEVPHEPNQLTMWDNRQLIHRALVDDNSARRVIQRVSVSSGSRPKPANPYLFAGYAVHNEQSNGKQQASSM